MLSWTGWCPWRRTALPSVSQERESPVRQRSIMGRHDVRVYNSSDCRDSSAAVYPINYISQNLNPYITHAVNTRWPSSGVTVQLHHECIQHYTTASLQFSGLRSSVILKSLWFFTNHRNSSIQIKMCFIRFVEMCLSNGSEWVPSEWESDKNITIIHTTPSGED